MVATRPVSYPVQMQVRVTRQDAAALARIAEQEETSRQEIVRRAVRREIELQEMRLRAVLGSTVGRSETTIKELLAWADEVSRRATGTVGGESDARRMLLDEVESHLAWGYALEESKRRARKLVGL